MNERAYRKAKREAARGQGAPCAAGEIPVGVLVRVVGASLGHDLVRAAASTVVNSMAGSVWTPRVVRYFLYRMSGMNVQTAHVSWKTTFLERDVSIGRNSVVEWGTVFGSGTVNIGERTRIGQQVAFVRADRTSAGISKLPPSPTVVGSRCWLGARVTVVAGVTIADECIVAAGSVVSHDLLQPGIYAGCPAQLMEAGPPANGRPRISALRTGRAVGPPTEIRT